MWKRAPRVVFAAFNKVGDEAVGFVHSFDLDEGETLFQSDEACGYVDLWSPPERLVRVRLDSGPKRDRGRGSGTEAGDAVPAPFHRAGAVPERVVVQGLRSERGNCPRRRQRGLMAAVAVAVPIPLRRRPPPMWRNPWTVTARQSFEGLLDVYLEECLAGCPRIGHIVGCKKRLADLADAFVSLL